MNGLIFDRIEAFAESLGVVPGDPGLPGLSSITPNEGVLFDTVLLEGTNLLEVIGVTLNGYSAAFAIASSGQIVVQVPDGSGTGNVAVETSGYGAAPLLNAWTFL